MKINILFVLLFFPLLNIKAQDTTRVKRCDSTICYVFRKRSSEITMDGKRLSSERLEQRLNMFRSSAYEYNECKRSQNISLGATYAGLAAILAGQIVLHSNHNVANSTTTFLGLAFIVSVPIFLVFSNKSSKHFKRSIDYYNREICNKPLYDPN